MSKNRSRNRRKANRGISIIAIILLAIIIGLAAFSIFQAIRPEPDLLPGTTPINLRFFNTATGEFVTEPRHIVGIGQIALLNAAFDEWVWGSSNPLHTHFLPESAIDTTTVQLLSNGYVRVTFAQALDLIPIEITACHTSLVWSLTSLAFVDNVQIYVGDTYIRTRNRDNTHLYGSDIQQPFEKIVVVLYFGDEMGISLTREERTIERNLLNPVEEYVMQLLLAGPAEEARRAIPANVTLRSIYTENSISYVNFDSEFRAGSSAAERFMIFSIVNSLTELEHISKVQFLIDNRPIGEEMGFHLSLSTPIERDESLIP